MPNSIEEKAESRLHGSDRLELRQIRCEFHNCVLTLKGTVSSYEIRSVAQELIKDLKGIEIIDNQIIVKEKKLASIPS
jgi:osmotically-inducible protein OsmY